MSKLYFGGEPVGLTLWLVTPGPSAWAVTAATAFPSAPQLVFDEGSPLTATLSVDELTAAWLLTSEQTAALVASGPTTVTLVDPVTQHPYAHGHVNVTNVNGTGSASQIPPGGALVVSSLNGVLNLSYTVTGEGGAVDATTTTKGIVQLAGDLSGTATAPTVPGLAGKANTSHTHAPADVTGTAVITSDARLSDARTPTAHSHPTSDVTGLDAALSGKAATSHSHVISDTTGLQAALDGKQAAGSYAAASHDHVAADIDTGASLDGQVLTSDGAGAAAWETPASGVTDHGLLSGLADDDHAQYALADGSRGSFATTAQGALAASASQPGHAHAAGDVTSGTLAAARLPAATTSAIGAVELATTGETTTGTDTTRAVTAAGVKAVADTKANTSHTHAISDTTGLQTALDGKAATSHTHTLANITDAGTAAAAATTDFATAAQGALADSATQPGDLATVATTGDYDDLTDKPTLGDAAAKNTGTTAGTLAAGDDSRITGAAQKSANLSDLANTTTARTNLGLGSAATTASTDYATAAQGALADTALQVATAQPINAQTGTSYTLVAGDAGKLVTLTNAAAITLNAPGSVFTAGQQVDVVVLGAGMATVVGTSGATANGTPSLVSRAQYSAFTVKWLSATSAVVIGDLA